MKGSPVTTLQWHGCLCANIWGSSLFFNPLFLASAKSALIDEKLSDSVGCLLKSKYFWNLPDCTQYYHGAWEYQWWTRTWLFEMPYRHNTEIFKESFLYVYTKGPITPAACLHSTLGDVIWCDLSQSQRSNSFQPGCRAWKTKCICQGLGTETAGLGMLGYPACQNAPTGNWHSKQD